MSLSTPSEQRNTFEHISQYLVLKICWNVSSVQKALLKCVEKPFIWHDIIERIDFSCKKKFMADSCMTEYQVAKFMGSTWGPTGSCRPHVGPMLAPWTLHSAGVSKLRPIVQSNNSTYFWRASSLRRFPLCNRPSTRHHRAECNSHFKLFFNKISIGYVPKSPMTINRHCRR